jgi:hypothetical protein
MGFRASADLRALGSISHVTERNGLVRVCRGGASTQSTDKNNKKGTARAAPYSPKIVTSLLRCFFTSPFLEHRQQLPAPFRKLALRHDQAHNQMPILRKIVKMPRMNVNPFLRQQIHRKLIIGSRRRHAHNRIPSTLDLQPRARLPYH